MPGAFLPEWIGAGAALLVLFAFVYTKMRRVDIAAVTTLAPLPGYLLAIALHAPSQPLGYLSGFILAVVFVSAVEMQVCDGNSQKDATKQAISGMGAAMAWLLTLPVVAAAVSSVMSGSARPALLVLCSGASALSISLLAVRYIPYDDQSIVRANRLRERRERWLDHLAFVVQPRWGWSVAGIVLIFAVIGFFEEPNSGVGWRLSPLILMAESLSFAIVACAAIRNGRRVLAFLFAMVTLALLASWIGARLQGGAWDMWLTFAVAAMPTLAFAIQSAKFERSGDTVAVASLRASERASVPLAFACLATAIALLAFGAPGGAVLVLLGGFTALVAFPAITTAICDLFPRRISPDAYRIR